MNARAWRLAILSGVIAGFGIILLLGNRMPRAQGPLRHEAYVWQRSWTQPVREAVRQHLTNFASLVLLKAEISWENGQPQAARVAFDLSSLTNQIEPVGLALRIAPYAGPFTTNDPASQFVIATAASMVAEARTRGLVLNELQMDFDCAESKLAGYLVWIEAIQRRVSPLPVTITTLPSWLNARDFPALVRQATNYVLQVHSLDRPSTVASGFTICDPDAARRAVERAGRIGVPFRVALPTYGYTLAFRPDGTFLGLSAEGPRPNWPTNAVLRTVRADASQVSGLVRAWTSSRPAALTSVIWFRLPTRQDRLNWDWAELQQVMAGATAGP